MKTDVNYIFYLQIKSLNTNMDSTQSSDVSEIGSENEYGQQGNNMDQCVPFEDDNINNDSDVEDWLQSDPGNLDELLGTEDALPLNTCTSPSMNPSSFTYESETDVMEYEAFESKQQCSLNGTDLPRMQIPDSYNLVKGRSMHQTWNILENEFFRIIRSHNIQLANEASECTPQKEFPSAPVIPRESVSVGVQTDPIRNKIVIWKSTRYQEGQKEIEIVEMEEIEYV